MSTLHVHVHAACPCLPPLHGNVHAKTVDSAFLLSVLYVHVSATACPYPHTAECPYLYAVCPRCFSMLLVYHACQFCMSKLYVHAACPCCMSVEYVRAPCPCLYVACPCCYVLAPCPCSMSMLHVHAPCPCLVSMFHVHSACSCCLSWCMSMSPVHAAYPCCASILHAHSSRLCLHAAWHGRGSCAKLKTFFA